jgi:hypothetical protein
MTLIPSFNGVSHHWSEEPEEEVIVSGAQCFADAGATILSSL